MSKPKNRYVWAKHAEEVWVHPFSSKFQLVIPLAELLPGGLTLLLLARAACSYTLAAESRNW